MIILNITDHGIFNLTIANETACMSFNPEGDRYPVELIDSSFQREVRYLKRFESYQWCPRSVKIDFDNRKIYFDWYNADCENYLPLNYVQQLEQITKDLHQEQVYKPSFYPKYFFSDTNDIMCAFAFYSSSDYSEQPINMNFYRPILNEQRARLVSELETDGNLDMSILIKHAFTDYIKWPGDPLPVIYSRVY